MASRRPPPDEPWLAMAHSLLEPGAYAGALGETRGGFTSIRYKPVAVGASDVLTLYGEDYPTPDGTCVRDYIHVSDLATAHLSALRAARPGTHQIFNLGNGHGFSNREVVDVVRAVTGRPVPVTVAARRPGDPAVLVADATRAGTELGWVPARPELSDIVGDAWEFLRTT